MTDHPIKRPDPVKVAYEPVRPVKWRTRRFSDSGLRRAAANLEALASGKEAEDELDARPHAAI